MTCNRNHNCNQYSQSTVIMIILSRNQDCFLRIYIIIYIIIDPNPATNIRVNNGLKFAIWNFIVLTFFKEK